MRILVALATVALDAARFAVGTYKLQRFITDQVADILWNLSSELVLLKSKLA